MGINNKGNPTAPMCLGSKRVDCESFLDTTQKVCWLILSHMEWLVIQHTRWDSLFPILVAVPIVLIKGYGYISDPIVTGDNLNRI